MKKITLLFATIFVAMSAMAQVTITKNWERSDSLNNNFVWNSSGDVTRGMAYGKMGANERVFVTTRHTSGNKVNVFNALTGDSVATLNMTGVTGGIHVMADAGMTEDGVLLVSNLQTAVSSTAPLKIYKWVNETDAPTIAVQWGPAVAEGRYGDKITVTGNYSTGSARIYAVKNITGTANIKYWDMTPDLSNPGTYIFNQEPKNLFDVAGLGVLASIGLRPDNGCYYKINGANIKQYTSAGVLVGAESSSSIIASSGNNVRYIGDNDQGDAIICYFRYSTVATTFSNLGNHKVEIVRVVGNNLANATILGTTPSLGNNANGNGAGGLAINKLLSNDVEVYVLSTNNGLAKYTLSGLFITTSVDKKAASNIDIKMQSSSIFINGIAPSSIELFNTIGQKVKSVTGVSEMSTDNLQGVYIVQVKAAGKIVKTGKIVIK